MNKGQTVKVVEYPDDNVVGMKGVITHVPTDDNDDYYDVDLFGPPDPSRPHVTNFLFFPEEIEVVS